ncbi:MAG: SGNH/GDSL hydrolase family protein [Ruminococcus sp.]|nr:SGNH/GDSL hydrolase family protein [Ruminococcus sp.]
MRIKKFFAVFIAMAVAACGLASCGSADSSEGETASAPAAVGGDSSEESAEPEKLPETDEEWHQAMIDKSLVTVGATAPMLEKIKKAQDGEEVTIAYLGGSITEGISAGSERCYARLSYEYFAETFSTGDNVKYVNAGLSGTPSILGNVRLQRDVLDHDPDICFVEFAVNDGTNEDYQAAYESIIISLLEHDVAVVLLFSVTADDYSAQDYMKEIGTAYQLPMISYCDALRFMFENDKMKWKDFSDDKSHPNVKGHALVAEMVDHYFDEAAKTDGSVSIMPDRLNSMCDTGITMLENDGIDPESAGSWAEGSTISTFTKGWTYDPEGDNEPIVFKFKGKFAYLIYKEVGSGSFGTLHVKITCDGELYDEKDIQTVTSSGWGNPQVNLLGLQPVEKEYEIEISMAEGSEDMQGEILAVAHS